MSTDWGFDTGGEPDQATVANRTTDFNPDWIRRIVRFVSDLVKLGFIVEENPQERRFPL